QTGHIALRYGGAYLVAGAALLTLQRLQGLGLVWAAPPWYGVWTGLLALGFLLVGRCAGRPWPPADRRAWRPSPGGLLRSPVFQVAFLLTLSPLLSPGAPAGGPPGQAPAILAMCGVYAGATVLLRRRELAYVSVALLLMAYGALLSLAGVPSVALSLFWAGFAAVLLLAGLSVVGILGAFATPLYGAGHVALLLALGWGVARLYPAPDSGGASLASVPAAVGLLAVVALYAGAAVRRRSPTLLYPACWLFPLPVTGLAGLLFAHLGWPMTEAHLGRILAALAVGYLALAFALDRSAWPFSKPVYLTAYALLPLATLYSALDRVALVQVLGLVVGALGWSAWLVDRHRHRAYLWLTERLFRGDRAPALPAARALFLYLACWLFPAWLLLAMGLWRPAPAVALYGLALTLLAPLYVGLGRRRAEYRAPWYLSGYALSGMGPLVALGDPLLGPVTLAVSVALYAVSAAVSRRSAWVTLVALLLPVLLWQTLDGLAAFERGYGLGLVLLGLLYVVAGAVLQHPGRLSLPRLARQVRWPIEGDVSPFALPFFVTAYALSALGLARVANQDRGLVVAGFLAGAALYGGSAWLFRQRLFAYPVAACLSVVYVVGATLTPLDPGRVGLGLLPGVVALLTG
ncbi:MAG TPA: hypothetical protein VH257_21395, partial [Chloroflexota bacterium]|nr:hypothetical protein [Chloroflexota bacterium]